MTDRESTVDLTGAEEGIFIMPIPAYVVLKAHGGYEVGDMRLYPTGSAVAAQAVRAGLLARDVDMDCEAELFVTATEDGLRAEVTEKRPIVRLRKNAKKDAEVE